MAKVYEILQYLYTLAPGYMKEDWDNVGLAIGRRDREVSRILVALDAVMPVLQETKERDCQLVVTHHPLIFGGLKQINEDSVTGLNALFALENGIACINMHTNLDCVADGVNDILARKLQLQDVYLPNPKGKDEGGREYGYIRAGTVQKCTIEAFAETVKKQLGCKGLRYADGGRPVCKVAVGGGACGDELRQVVAADCDTFVTADLKYHMFSDARSMGVNLIDAGHYQTEVPVCEYLQQRMAEAFKDVEVILSQKQDDPICFV